MANAKDYLICIDAGHGMGKRGDGYKETPNIPGVGIIKEFEFNKPTAGYLDQALKRCGFRTLRTSTTDVDVSLPFRTNLANKNKADIFISIHYNHSGKEHPGHPGANGVETYYLVGLPSNGDTARLAKTVHKYLTTSNILKQKDRGVKTNNYQVLRETNMPAILIEFGFMDDEGNGYKEAKAMINPLWQKERAEKVAMGVCEYFGVKYIAPGESTSKPVTPEKPASHTLFRVVVDGKNIGAWSTTEYLLSAIEKEVKNKPDKIVVEKV